MINQIIEQIKTIPGIESAFHVEGIVLAVYLKEEATEQLCQYESDNTTAMNCKHCGNPKWTHDCCKLG